MRTAASVTKRPRTLHPQSECLLDARRNGRERRRQLGTDDLHRAEFSYDQDLKTGIEAMALKLTGVVYHRKLGSLADKTRRLQARVQKIGELVAMYHKDIETATEAARLAKAQPGCIRVQEFSDLEGNMGPG